eukprot:s24_g49.t1
MLVFVPSRVLFFDIFLSSHVLKRSLKSFRVSARDCVVRRIGDSCLGNSSPAARVARVSCGDIATGAEDATRRGVTEAFFQLMQRVQTGAGLKARR